MPRKIDPDSPKKQNEDVVTHLDNCMASLYGRPVKAKKPYGKTKAVEKARNVQVRNNPEG